MKVAAVKGGNMDDVAGIFAREFPAVDGYIQVGVAQGRVISVDFPARPKDDARADHDLLDRLGDYLNGDSDAFGDVTVALTLPTDERRILEALRENPAPLLIGDHRVGNASGATPTEVATVCRRLEGL